MRNRRRRAVRPIVDYLDDRCLLSGTAGYTPAQITAAYGLNAITFPSNGTTVKGDGTGETIALIEMYHDPNLTSDLATFDTAYGLSAPPSLKVDNLGGSQTNNDWALEESLDVEWTHAIAPGANILVVEAAPGNTDNQALQNLMTAVNTASTTPGVAVVSMSWGFSEFPNETSDDSAFTTTGITYIAASGDTPGVDYPAASPNVLAVGGTTLNLNSAARSSRRLPGIAPVAATASTSRSRATRSRSRARASGARPTSPSMPTPIPASPSTRRRPRAEGVAGDRQRARAPGKSWAGRAWARPPGRGSLRSSTRVAPWPARRV